MSVHKTRGFLYQIARLLGDYQSVEDREEARKAFNLENYSGRSRPMRGKAVN